MSPVNDTTTQGFDLDALPNNLDIQDGQDSDVIYELGGGATVISNSSTTTAAPSASQDTNEQIDALAESEALKQKGNECFKQGNYLDAIDYYTDAIEACPGMKGEEILSLQEQHEEKEREKANQRYKRETDRKLSTRKNIVKNRTFRSDRDKSNDAQVQNDEDKDDDDVDAVDDEEDEDEDDLSPEEFKPPVHPYGKQLAIYYSNKAASFIHLDRYSEALKCCNLAILLDSTYSKAYIRRMTCHEQTEETDLALQDAKKAFELNPRNVEIRNHVRRLEKIEAERMETLKKETMEKLKGLGNSILGNFGMSLDNFKAEKDPVTGSYSIRMV